MYPMQAFRLVASAMPHHDVMNDRGTFDPPVDHDVVPHTLHAIHYNDLDASGLLRRLESMDPAVAQLPADTREKYIGQCRNIASYRSLHAESLRADRPSLMGGPFALPDPLRQSHLRQACEDRKILDDIKHHLGRVTARCMEEALLAMQLQMGALEKVAKSTGARPPILQQAAAFLKSQQQVLTASSPYAFGMGKAFDLSQRLTMQMKASIKAFEALEDLSANVSVKHLGAQREAYFDAFVKAQDAASQCDMLRVWQHIQMLEHLSAGKRRSQERTSLTML